MIKNYAVERKALVATLRRPLTWINHGFSDD
jgi:hypothetical protein